MNAADFDPHQHRGAFIGGDRTHRDAKRVKRKNAHAPIVTIASVASVELNFVERMRPIMMTRLAASIGNSYGSGPRS